MLGTQYTLSGSQWARTLPGTKESLNILRPHGVTNGADPGIMEPEAQGHPGSLFKSMNSET